MIPIVFFLLVLGAILVAAKGSALAPLDIAPSLFSKSIRLWHRLQEGGPEQKKVKAKLGRRATQAFHRR